MCPTRGRTRGWPTTTDAGERLSRLLSRGHAGGGGADPAPRRPHRLGGDQRQRRHRRRAPTRTPTSAPFATSPPRGPRPSGNAPSYASPPRSAWRRTWPRCCRRHSTSAARRSTSRRVPASCGRRAKADPTVHLAGTLSTSTWHDLDPIAAADSFEDARDWLPLTVDAGRMARQSRIRARHRGHAVRRATPRCGSSSRSPAQGERRGPTAGHGRSSDTSAWRCSTSASSRSRARRR